MTRPTTLHPDLIAPAEPDGLMCLITPPHDTFEGIRANLALPLECTVMGVRLTIERLEQEEHGAITAIGSRGGASVRLPLEDLPIPAGTPGAEWVAAYRSWNR